MNTKKSNNRKEEILDLSESMFVDKGFNDTSLNSIIKILKIAKGTFYHYFSSKDELLDSLLMRVIDDILSELQPMLNSTELNAIEKLNLFYKKSGKSKVSKKQMGRIKVFMKLFKNSYNSKFVHKMQEMTVIMIAPEIEKIILQGINENVFVSDYPKELAKLILNIGFSYQKDFIELFGSHRKYEDVLEEMNRILRIYQVSIERILGAEPGVIQIIEDGVVETFLNEMK